MHCFLSLIIFLLTYIPIAQQTANSDNTVPLDFDLEQEIINLNVTRLSKLPEGSKYTIRYSLASPGGMAPHSSIANINQLAVITTYGVKCETTSGSPTTYDVIRALARLNLLGEDALCCQKNPWGSKCTRMADKDSASLAICGDRSFCMYCSNAVELMLAIVDMCIWNHLVGGLFDLVVSDAKLTIYHS